MYNTTLGLKIYLHEAFNVGLGMCCMNLAVAKKLKCMCDEVITTISDTENSDII